MSNSDSQLLRDQAKSLRQQGKLVPSLMILDRIIDAGDANVDDWRDVGLMMCELGEYAQAVGAFEHAIGLDSDDRESQYEIGRARYQLGDSDRSAESIERVARDTDHIAIWQSLASIAPGVPRLNAARVLQIRRHYAKLVRGAEGGPRKRPRPSRHSPLRIGYLSAHWHDANYMKPVWPTINHHDCDQFEIHLLDDSGIDAQSWSWLENDSVERHSVSHHSNSQLAQFIRDREIDVLVDLSGYSAPQRLGVFVHRPAAVQAAWFNSFATSGFQEFDWIIGDEAVMKDGESTDYVEKFFSLPVSYLTFQTNHRAPDVAVSPHQSNGTFTFGSLGTQYKLTGPVLDAWSSILSQASSSRLLLSNRMLKSPQNQAYVIEQFGKRGIDSQQIEFAVPAAHYDFLRHYDRIDLALDTFPYNGGTTTMEAIWQGVPVLTFDGDRWASRTSASLLLQSHLSEFVAATVDDYVRLAVMFANEDPAQVRLRSLRQTMRQRLCETSVCDSARLASELEAAYTAMHRHVLST